MVAVVFVCLSGCCMCSCVLTICSQDSPISIAVVRQSPAQVERSYHNVAGVDVIVIVDWVIHLRGSAGSRNGSKSRLYEIFEVNIQDFDRDYMGGRKSDSAYCRITGKSHDRC
jgi:hypothetical protein